MKKEKGIVLGQKGLGIGSVLSQGVSISGLGSYEVVVGDGTYSVDTSGWFPFELSWDMGPVRGSAVDRSWLLDPPAGKHGFLKVEGDQFVFEDGTGARFWGTNFSAGANFPAHEQAEKIAKRIAGYGFNLVRLHHLDAGWTKENIFDQNYDDTQHLDAEKLDRLDYLIYCLKREGIYVYLDMLVTRYFKPGDGVQALDEMATPTAKGFTYFHPTLIELQKKYIYDLWTHYNPYTKLRYCDDPVFVLTELVNENDLFSTRDQLLRVEPYASMLKEKFNVWQQGKNMQPEELTDLSTSETLEFLSDLQEDFYREMMDYLREIGVKIPIAGTNWCQLFQDRPSQLVCDFIDTHRYWDHPTNNNTVMRNVPMLKNNRTTFDYISFAAIHGKPFFISEWGHPAFNFYRAEAPLWTAAVGSFQSWNGMALYTYRHSADPAVKHIEGRFNTFNDPLYYGLLPIAAAIYLRGDVAPADREYVVRFPETEELFKLPPLNIYDLVPAYSGGLVEKSKVRNSIGGAALDNVQEIPYFESALPDNNTQRQSDTGQLVRDLQEGILLIKSPSTEAVQGFVGGKEITLPNMKVTTANEFAVIALSSADSREIAATERFLLTTVSRVENTGTVYNFRKTKELKSGSSPVLVEPVEAEIELLLDGNFSVWALNEIGERKYKLPVEDNKFRTSGIYEAIWYEIVRE